jgi:LuxR family maltose regulon positive regulatory protein
MGLTAEAEAGDDSGVPAVRGGIVSRRVLFERLGRAGRVTVVSAPAGSGKTFLLRSWIAEAGLADSAAWVPVPDEEFSGSERTVAEYLLAEVLDRQAGEVRRLLLRTSVLERVNGELAELLTGGSGGERILLELEAASAFVVSLDARRSWFRYHPLFADLLQLELRRTEPDEVPALHAAAAGWYARHGYPVEAVRHTQAAEDWSLAARLLSDHWLGLVLDGQAATGTSSWPASRPVRSRPMPSSPR